MVRPFAVVRPQESSKGVDSSLRSKGEWKGLAGGGSLSPQGQESGLGEWGDGLIVSASTYALRFQAIENLTISELAITVNFTSNREYKSLIVSDDRSTVLTETAWYPSSSLVSGDFTFVPVASSILLEMDTWFWFVSQHRNEDTKEPESNTIGGEVDGATHGSIILPPSGTRSIRWSEGHDFSSGGTSDNRAFGGVRIIP